MRRVRIETIDWSFAIRPINPEHVERLGGAANLPAIKVWEFRPGEFRGIDGFHRWRVAKDRGEATVPAIVRRFPKGAAGERAFELECVQSNLRHGLPLSRQERDRAIVQIWHRWGRSNGRSDGESLDRLGKLFNLTKQRVHQIVAAVKDSSPEAGGTTDRVPAERAPSRETARHPTPGGFSGYGRFTAATKRLSRLLTDVELVRTLIGDRPSDVVNELQQLRELIDEILGTRG